MATHTTPARVALIGDIWGGFAAMLVALPSAIGFGVVVFAPLGAEYGGRGAVAGIVGVAALGLVAALLGGTKRLISAPCAPAAAVLSALTLTMAQAATPPENIITQLMLLIVLGAVLQLGFGLLRLGLLIKYMPYAVVSGYLSGVGVYLILSQLPRLMGLPKGVSRWQGLTHTHLWRWQSWTIGIVTAAAMLIAPKITQKIPAVIVALLAGIGSYGALSYFDPGLRHVVGNTLLVGPLGSLTGSQGVSSLLEPWYAIARLSWADIELLLIPAATLAVLLSIDTLKTCVVLDSMTRSRHDSNRELMGQGLGNLMSGIVGGMPGAGTMGATLVNLASGAQSRWSGVMEGVFALLAFALLSWALAWIPLATLAGILTVIGFRMMDTHSLKLLQDKATVLDFCVIATVVIVANTISLIAASGIGVALAIVLYVREQVKANSVARYAHVGHLSSRRLRVESERALLDQYGHEAAVFELQGSLFFGTTDQLLSALEPEANRARYMVIDLRRVQSMDTTAAHMFERIGDTLKDRGALLLFSSAAKVLPNGQNLQAYLSHLGLLSNPRGPAHFDQLSEAIEWVEDDLLAQHAPALAHAPALTLAEFDLFNGRRPDTLAALAEIVETRTLAGGEKVFAMGDQGDELFLIARGEIRIEMPLAEGKRYYLVSLGRGDFFGEMAFLDAAPRSADAYAEGNEAVLYVLSRQRFNDLVEQHHHHHLGMAVSQELAKQLAARLRRANADIRVLQES